MRLRATRLTAIATAVRRLFNPASLFASGAPGVWYDLSLTDGTLFQDAAGTTPVTAVEQPVGLLKDKSGRNNHAYQTTSANRPVLSARYNLLTETEDFDDSAWVKTNASVASNSVMAPDGTLTADKLVTNLSQSNGYVTELVSVTAGVVYRFSCYAKSAGATNIRLRATGSGTWASVVVDLTTGTVSGTLLTGVATATSIGGGWYNIAVTAASDFTGTNLLWIYDFNTGDGTSGIYIWGADLRVANDGVNLPPYQAVRTATDYDTVGFPLYLRFNGSTQFLQTNSINFSSTDKVLVAAGVRKLSDAATGVVAEISPNATEHNGTFSLYNSSTTTVNGFGFFSHVTNISAAPVTSGYPPPVTSVLFGLGDISGDRATLRINGAQVAQNTADQGTGSYGNYPLYIGARGGNVLFFNGRLYSLIIAGIKPTDAQILGVETYINRLTRAF